LLDRVSPVNAGFLESLVQIGGDKNGHVSRFFFFLLHSCLRKIKKGDAPALVWRPANGQATNERKRFIMRRASPKNLMYMLSTVSSRSAPYYIYGVGSCRSSYGFLALTIRARPPPLLCLLFIARQVRAFAVSLVLVASAIRAARLSAVKELDFQ
jgi:hypothetical protein